MNIMIPPSRLKAHKLLIYVYCSILFLPLPSRARSIHRPLDPYVPEIHVSWVDKTEKYILRNYHIEEYPLFKLFDKEFFNEHLLPKGTIDFLYDPTQSVACATLTVLIEELIQEIQQKKKRFTHFTVLQNKDFRKGKGLIVLKFNDYPFVVKLFIETPDSFISPFDKGLEPIFFFFMGGGVNRHLSGFTRIKNLEIIKKRLAGTPWQDKVSLPRKWYWLPQHAPWIDIVGRNIGGKTYQHIQLPGTYCIVADTIEAERNLSLIRNTDKKIALDLCNYLDLWIDPHITNFMIEKGTKKLALIDTEHFPSFVGLKEKVTFDSYTSWYLHLAAKCIQNEFLQTKRERRNPKKCSSGMRIA